MSVEKQEEILDMVRRQLRRSNPPDTEALYGRAARIDGGIRDLSLRQFNARYPLRVRREMARAEKAGGEKEKVSEETVEGSMETLRADLRSVLLEFAREVTATPEGPEFQKLIGLGVAEYVDRVEALLPDE